MIKGEKVYLTELDRGNAETIRGWLNDPEVHEFLVVGHIPITREAEEHYYDRLAGSADRFTFEIHLTERKPTRLPATASFASTPLTCGRTSSASPRETP